MSRLLFITGNRIGDAILSTGLLNRYLRDEPDCRATVAAGPAPAPLLETIDGVERVIVLRKRPRGGHWRDLWRAALPTRWDQIVDLRGSGIAWTLRAGKRMTFSRDHSFDHRVVQLGRFAGFVPPPAPSLPIDPARAAEIDERVPDGPVLALGPTANWEGKRWPADRFVELALRLTGEPGPLEGASILIAGAPGERELVADAVDRLPGERTLDLFGADLPLAAAGLARASLFVGNDSGLMHLAAAVGTPTLGLFGPSRPEHYAPWGERTAWVRTTESYDDLTTAPGYDHRTTGSLMTSLSVDRVEQASRALLAGAGIALETTA